MKDMVLKFSEDRVVLRCEKKGCNGLMKPDIVFFGESLPPEFTQSPKIIQRETDLLIVIGTSLTVHPFASLALLCPDECPRALINIDLVGDFGSRDDDVVLLGKCDEVIEELCEELGWKEELMKLWEETARSTDAGAAAAASASESQDEEEEEAEEATTPTQEKSAAGKGASGGDEKKLEDEVAKLAEKIQKEMDLRRASVEPEENVPPPSSDNTPMVVAPSLKPSESKSEASSAVDSQTATRGEKEGTDTEKPAALSSK
ncbi:hypothetical protein GYMLUDRAFT_252406 [Collybiopsis luxurians FD-317 M1]|uniref:Deacetylase sirtuin-type domain-containing protein n=1 Tax=Collybiopsis luxurians FD-317 M1 TaxID=944289 RepID=A0A0D0B9Z1_9AGAR|nr:hypothetical protein GYMLUDRAFT_252406 [Collybiopsis luxurians FD-317 M1]